MFTVIGHNNYIVKKEMTELVVRHRCEKSAKGRDCLNDGPAKVEITSF